MDVNIRRQYQMRWLGYSRGLQNGGEVKGREKYWIFKIGELVNRFFLRVRRNNINTKTEILASEKLILNPLRQEFDEIDAII